MKWLPARIALATLALLIGVLVFAAALVLSLRPGLSVTVLVQPTAALFGVALCAAIFAYSHTRELVRELGTLRDELRAPRARASVLPSVRFAESQVLRNELGALLSNVRRAESARDAERARSDAPLALRIRFVAAMGHDLRTPLNAMLGFADLLALDRGSGWNAQQRRSLEILRERTRDLLGLIDDMIDWAKLEAGELQLSPREHDVGQLVERAVEAARQRSGARGLRVTIEQEVGLPRVFADEGRVVQSLLGLMDNAARSDSSPMLSIKVSRARASTRQVAVEITDPQLEIREADREHMFHAFRPSFAPSGRRIAGLSLGTAMARALMRAQGGDVWFEGRPERGTTFVLTLPAGQEQPRS